MTSAIIPKSTVPRIKPSPNLSKLFFITAHLAVSIAFYILYYTSKAYPFILPYSAFLFNHLFQNKRMWYKKCLVVDILERICYNKWNKKSGDKAI